MVATIRLVLTKDSYNFTYDSLAPLSVIFPDSFLYPRKGLEACSINVTLTDKGIIGEGKIEFTRGGEFGYIIFSKGRPFFYAAEQKMITVAPPETRLEMQTNNMRLGITIIGSGVSLLPGKRLYELLRKWRRTTKRRKARKSKR